MLQSKTKFFTTENNRFGLDEQINKFLEEFNILNVKEIKYSSTFSEKYGYPIYSALLIYEVY